MDHCAHRIGDAYFRTPRTTVKEFLNLLAVLEQNPGTDWRALVGQIELVTETIRTSNRCPRTPPQLLHPVTALRPGRDTDDELSTFRL